MAQTEVSNFYSRVVLIRKDTEPLDITDSVQSITISENIFQPCVTCNILFLDTTEFTTTYPVMGYESVIIEGLDTSLFFRIYSMKDYKVIEGNRAGFTLSFIAYEYILDKQKKVSQAYRDVTISDIVSDVFRNQLSGEFEILEKTVGKTSLILPNKSPLETIKWLCGRANREGGRGTFLFYGTFSNGYIFSSLENLTSLQDEIPKYTRTVSNNTEDSKRDDMSFTKFEVNERFDTLLNIDHGMYASKTLVHSLIDRDYTVSNFNYLRIFGADNNSLLGDIPLIGDGDDILNESFDSKQFLLPDDKHIYETDLNISNRKVLVSDRMSKLRQINNNTSTIRVTGNFERYSGEIIELVDSVENIEDIKDKKIRYSGRQYILGIKHVFTTNEHHTVLQLAKDGYDRG